MTINKILLFLYNKDITLDYAKELIEDIILTEEDKDYLFKTLGLMNSIINSGEQHSNYSKERLKIAKSILIKK